MADFTQKLLQRTQARKVALARKREVLGLSRSDVSSPRPDEKDLRVVHSKPSTIGKENNNRDCNASKFSAKPPQKRESSEKDDICKAGFEDKRKKFEGTCQANSIRGNSKIATPATLAKQKQEPYGGSILERLTQLQSQTKRFEGTIQEKKRERQQEFSRQKDAKPASTPKLTNPISGKIAKPTSPKKTYSVPSRTINSVPTKTVNSVPCKTANSVPSKTANSMSGKNTNLSPSKKAIETRVPKVTSNRPTEFRQTEEPYGRSSKNSEPQEESSPRAGTPLSTCVIDRILGLMEADDPPTPTPVPVQEYPSEKRYSKTYSSKNDCFSPKVNGTTAKKDLENDKRFVKTYAAKEEIDSIKILKIGTNQRFQGKMKEPAPKPGPIDDKMSNYSAEDMTDISVSVSEVSDYLDSEQVDSTMNEDDDESYGSGSDGYSTGSESEEEAFDVEGVLEAAAQSATSKRQLSKQRLLPDEQQEFHVLSPATPSNTQREFDLNSSEVQDAGGAHLSGFEKMINDRRNQIKSPLTVDKLNNLDMNANAKAMLQVNEASSQVEDKKTTDGDKSAGNNATEQVSAEESSDGQFLGIEIPKMPLTPAFGTVNAKPKSRKEARRSVSFSGNRASPKVIFKSGYNEETSAKYNVKSNIMEAPRDKVKNASNQEKIQYFLEEAANHQSIVLQASQALNMSYGSSEDKRGCPEVVEGERLLLLATQKRTACLDEVQRLKDIGDPFGRSSKKDDGPVPPCKGTIVFSDINVPLNQDFMMALRAGRMDLGVFHFVVVVQYGPLQVFATRAVSTYDELSNNCLPFKEKITVKSVDHDFTVIVKVFGMHTKRIDVHSKGKRTASASKNKESPGIMNVFRRRVNSEESPRAPSPQKTIFRNSNFTLVGETKMNLSTIGAGKHVLNKVPSNSPLDGFILLNTRCLPEFAAKATGFLTLFEDVGGYNALNRRWCVLQNNTLSCWRYPGDENTKEPLTKIEFKWCVNEVVGLIPRDQCARPHTFEVILKRAATKDDKPSLLTTIDGKYATMKHWLSADNKEDRISWLDTINKLLSDHRAWQVKRSGVKREYTQTKNSLRASNRRMKKSEAPRVPTKC